MQLITELWNAFNDIFFVEETHTYTDSVGTDYKSVTGFVDRFVQHTDWNKIAEKCIASKKKKYEGHTVESLCQQWKDSSAYARTLGTEIHSVMENLWHRKDYAR